MTDDLGWLEEYDDVARWCASRGIKGHEGDRLPELVSERCKEEIESDPEAFRQRIRDTAYMLAMSRSALLEAAREGAELGACDED